METIFSTYYQPKQSNFLSALAPIVQTTTSLIGSACFGDAACQQNRELQSQAQLTTAQAQLAATNVAAMGEQNEAKQSQMLMYLGIGFLVVVTLLGSIFLLKKQ